MQAIFRLLVSRQVPAPIIQVLINVYIGNYVKCVTWYNIISDYLMALSRCYIAIL